MNIDDDDEDYVLFYIRETSAVVAGGHCLSQSLNMIPECLLLLL